MKRILATGSIAALAMIGFAGTANAAPPAKAACFGQVHKAVNQGAVDGFDNVGQLVKALGGPGKNAEAASRCP
jgi:hypothetical protein